MLPFLLAIVGVSNVSAISSNPKEQVQDISFLCNDSGNRPSCEIQLDVPESCVDSDGTSDCSIVFFLHGSGGNIRWFAKSSGVHENNVIGVYPQGEGGWNTGPKDSNACDWWDFSCEDDPDEGLLIKNIIDYLFGDGVAGHVFVTGNSNGAALAHRLASNSNEDLPIKGIITKVTQLLETPERSGPGNYNYNNPSPSSDKVSVLNIMGTADGLIPYEGGTSAVFGDFQTDFVLMSALESMVAWATHNGCNTVPVQSTHSSDKGTGEVIKYVYPDCSDGIIVEHYAIEGGDHGAGGASIDGVKIDYDLTYQFIRACESDGEDDPPTSAPAPTATTPPPTPATTSSCIDDPEWRGKNNSAHDCAFVANDPTKRCGWQDSSGLLAEDACAVSCGTCDDGDSTDPPTSAPVPQSTFAPTPATPPPSPPPTPGTSSSCIDDPEWRGKFDSAHDCSFISQNLARCGWEAANGVKAMEACKDSCDSCV